MAVGKSGPMSDAKAGDSEAKSAEGPRPWAPTLVGVGPERGPVVVGAVGRPDGIPMPVATDRTLFDAIGDEAEVDDGWPVKTPPAQDGAAPEQPLRPRTRS